MTRLWARETRPSSELAPVRGADAAGGLSCAECGMNGGLSGFRGYFQAKVCFRPPICTSKRPGSTMGLFSALMNDKSSFVSSKV
jgi:hypothetical protein